MIVQLLTALLVGTVFGYVGSMPVAGPVALLVLRQGLASQYRSAFYVAAGAAVAESGYACMALFGMSALLGAHPMVLPVTRVLGAVLLIALGTYFLVRRPRGRDEKHEREGVDGGQRGQRRAGFALGFTITALNPTLLVTWTAAVTALYSSGLVPVSTAQAVPFGLGAGAGVVGWFATLLWLLRRYKNRFRHQTLERAVQLAGLALLGLGLWFGVRAALEFATRRG